MKRSGGRATDGATWRQIVAPASVGSMAATADFQRNTARVRPLSRAPNSPPE